MEEAAMCRTCNKMHRLACHGLDEMGSLVRPVAFTLTDEMGPECPEPEFVFNASSNRMYKMMDWIHSPRNQQQEEVCAARFARSQALAQKRNCNGIPVGSSEASDKERMNIVERLINRLSLRNSSLAATGSRKILSSLVYMGCDFENFPSIEALNASKTVLTSDAYKAKYGELEGKFTDRLKDLTEITLRGPSTGNGWFLKKKLAEAIHGEHLSSLETNDVFGRLGDPEADFGSHVYFLNRNEDLFGFVGGTHHVNFVTFSSGDDMLTPVALIKQLITAWNRCEGAKLRSEYVTKIKVKTEIPNVARLKLSRVSTKNSDVKVATYGRIPGLYEVIVESNDLTTAFLDISVAVKKLST